MGGRDKDSLKDGGRDDGRIDGWVGEDGREDRGVMVCWTYHSTLTHNLPRIFF